MVRRGPHELDRGAWLAEVTAGALVWEFRAEQAEQQYRVAQVSGDAVAGQLAALRDALEQQKAIVAAISAFVQVERARRDEQGRGGQSVGYSPRISPSVLKELERLLLTAPQEPVK